MIVSGTNDETNKEVIELINKYSNIYGVIGIHPEEADNYNEESLKKLTDFNFVIGNLGYHGDYTKSGYVWINTIINRYSKQENNYCYVESKNEDYLKICALQKSYTIMPSIITKDNPLIEIKNNIKSGDIISLEINNQTLKQLPLIISYINSKGFKITSLDEFLSEDF